MFTIATLQKAWDSFIKNPTKSVTFLAILLFAWEKMDHIADNREKDKTIRESTSAVIQQVLQRMATEKELRQQVIESQGRLLDVLTRKQFDTSQR